MAPSLAHGGFDEINVMGTEPECRGRMDARERPRPSDCARVRCCFPFISVLCSKLKRRHPKRLASEVDFGAIKNTDVFGGAYRDVFTASPKAACGARRVCSGIRCALMLSLLFPSRQLSG